MIRRTSNPIGWLLLLIAFCFIATTARPGTDVQALQAGTAATGEFSFAWTSSWAGLVSYLAFVGLAVLFPSGHLPVNRWRWPTIACLTIGLCSWPRLRSRPRSRTTSTPASPNVVILNPFAILPGLPLWPLLPDVGLVALVFNLGLLVVAVAALVVRFRRSTGIDQLQLRWLASSVVLCIGAVAFGLGTLAIFGNVARVAWIPAIVAYPMVPIAIGIAILRYRLYDIDRIISRTLSYGVVTATWRSLRGRRPRPAGPARADHGGDTFAVAASTLVVAALFQPVRKRSRRSSTGASIGLATTASERSPPSRHAFAIRSTSRASGRTLTPSFGGPWPRPRSGSGSDRQGGRRMTAPRAEQDRPGLSGHRLVPSRRASTWIALTLWRYQWRMICFLWSRSWCPAATTPNRADIATVLAALCVFVSLPSVGAILAVLRPRNRDWLAVPGRRRRLHPRRLCQRVRRP